MQVTCISVFTRVPTCVDCVHAHTLHRLDHCRYHFREVLEGGATAQMSGSGSGPKQVPRNRARTRIAGRRGVSGRTLRSLRMTPSPLPAGAAVLPLPLLWPRPAARACGSGLVVAWGPGAGAAAFVGKEWDPPGRRGAGTAGSAGPGNFMRGGAPRWLRPPD